MAEATTFTLKPEEKYEIAVSYGTIIGTGTLALLVCCCRLYVRKFIIRTFGIDDWACLVGLLVTTAFNGIGIAVVHYGAGKHAEHVSMDDMKRWYMLYYVCICMYLFISFAVKSSIIFFLRRVFPTPYIQHTTMALLIFLVLFTISGSFVAAFQCNPPKYSYQLEFLMAPDRADYCFPANVSYGIFMYQAVLLFCCDVLLLFLPLPALLQLQMSSAKRTALGLVFGSGIVACIAPAVRFKSIQFYKSGSTDVTFISASSLYWMAIEYNLGMVAGSLTGLRPLLVKLGVFFLGTTKNSTDDPSGYKNYNSNSKQHRHFTPSYQLEDRQASGGGSKPWSFGGQRSRNSDKAMRVQGDSVLEHTMLGQQTVVGDHCSEDETDETHIVKK